MAWKEVDTVRAAKSGAAVRVYVTGGRACTSAFRRRWLTGWAGARAPH